MTKSRISLPVIRRLPKYYRYVSELERQGVRKVSSGLLAELMGSTPSQVRQDFNCFGGFGQQGVGYSVRVLKEELGKLLFPAEKQRAVLIGVGNLGVAVTNFIFTNDLGFSLLALFDADKALIGNRLRDIEILDVADLGAFCAANPVDIVIVCTPGEAAEELADAILATGTKGIWNFSSFDFSLLSEKVICENVHLADVALSLSYRMIHSRLEEDKEDTDNTYIDQ